MQKEGKHTRKNQFLIMEFMNHILNHSRDYKRKTRRASGIEVDINQAFKDLIVMASFKNVVVLTNTFIKHITCIVLCTKDFFEASESNTKLAGRLKFTIRLTT